MADEDTLIGLGVGAAVAATAAYAASRTQGTTDEPDGQTQTQGGLSTAALIALLSQSGGDQEQTQDPGGTSEPGEPEFRGENPADYGDTDDTLDGTGQYPDEGNTDAPDEGASGGQSSTGGTVVDGYRYVGDYAEAFRDYITGDITKTEFQTLTPQGEGTAAITNKDELGTPDAQTESERTRTFADPGLSAYVDMNPDANIGTFFPRNGYTVAKDRNRAFWPWIVLQDNGTYIGSADTRDEAESIAAGEPEFRSEDPTEYGDRFEGSDDTDTDGGSGGADVPGDPTNDEWDSEEEEDFWTGNL